MSVVVATNPHSSIPVETETRIVTGVPRGRSALLWARLAAVLSEFSASQPVVVLDCGGGSGSLAVPLAAEGAVVTVVDVSIDALATLLRRAREAGVSERVTAVQGDAEALAELVPPQSFDLVLAHGVLESVSSPAEAIAGIASVLRPGGVASLVVANPVSAVLRRVLAGDLGAALETFRRPEPESYALDALLTECANAGLVMDSVEGIGVFAELVPGIELERPGAAAALAQLETAVANRSPYREMASKLHVVARRPSSGTGQDT